MNIPGTIQNGVVVFDGSVALPEGAAVMVTLCSDPAKPAGRTRRRVDFPLIRSPKPGSIDLTNQRIETILSEEDLDATNFK